MSDTVTVLRSRSGVLTKRIARSAQGWTVRSYSAGAWYSVHERAVGDLGALADLLELLTARPRAAIVRGRLRPSTDPRRCRRLSDRVEHGDAVTFDPCPRRWLAADVDGLEEPPGCVFAAEPEVGIEHAIARFPAPFHDASCWWQATGSAGIKPGIHCRLWWWLGRPLDDAQLKGWLRGTVADLSLYTPVALHYVAAPVLAPGTPDPVVRRYGWRQGLVDQVEVPAALPRVDSPPGVAVDLGRGELTEADRVALAAAVLRSPAARAIWTGERVFPDRSTGHFALATALARAGCTDPDTLHRVLVAYDRRGGRDTAKVLRPDYARRTIGAALAAGVRP